MQRIKKVISILVCFCLISGIYLLNGCSTKSNKEIETIEKNSITDLSGRNIEVKIDCKRVIAIGPGALRLYCYVNNSEKIVGIENIDKENKKGRPYLLANPKLKELDVIGAGGPNNSPDPEKIIAVKPDVIFTTYADADRLQEKTGIPVVTLSYGTNDIFNDDLYQSIKVIGEVMKNEKRSEEVVEYIKSCKIDLENRTCEIKDSNLRVYSGAISMKGAHGIESTQGNNPLYNSIKANNIVDETGKSGSIMIDKEQLIKWNPDIIFIDYGGLNLVKDDYKENHEFYNSLQAFKNNKVYSLQPYNNYTTNIDTAISDAYYMGSIIYPDKFNDITPGAKADEIYKFLLGQSLYEKMSSDFGEFKKIIVE